MPEVLGRRFPEVKPVLNPEWPEWMMGLPHGWITDPGIGLTRKEQIKAAGNGVVPQQGAAALRLLIARTQEGFKDDE